MSTIAQFSGLGIDFGMQRYIFQFRTENKMPQIKYLISFTYILKLISMVILSLTLIILFLYKSSIFSSTSVLLIIIGFVFFKTMVTTLANIDYTFERYNWWFFYGNMESFLVLLFVPVFFIYFGILGGLVGHLFALSLPFVCGFVYNRKYLKSQFFEIISSKISLPLKDIVKFGIPVYLSKGLEKISPAFGVFVLAYLFGKDTPNLAYFSLSSSFISCMGSLIVIALSVMYPKLVKEYDCNKKLNIESIINREITLLSILSILIITSYFLFGKQIILWILPKYVGICDFMNIIIWILLVQAIYYPYIRLSSVYFKPSVELERFVIYLLSFITIYPILVSKYKALGVAFSFLIIELLICFFIVFRLYGISKIKIRLQKIVGLFLFSFVFMFVPFFFQGILRVFSCITLICLWLVCLIQLKIVDKKDIILIQNFVLRERN